MCGIFAVVNDVTGNAAQTVLEGLKKLEYRGYDSWGIAVKAGKDQGLSVDKRVGKIGEANTSLQKGTIAIGHTRWATHGGVTDANAHPHLDCRRKIAVIHNGIVENYQSLKASLLEAGHEFTSETDTETVAHTVEDKMKASGLREAVFATFNSLSGSNAIGVLDSETETIVAVRNGSPLVVGIDDKNGQFFLGSDVPAFLKFTNKVYFMEDGDGVVLTKQGIKLYDAVSGSEKKITFTALDWKLEDAEKSGYPHFLLKEIHEQARTVPRTAALNKEVIPLLAEKIKGGARIILSGCGTAGYCAMMGKYFLAAAGADAQVYTANEYLPFSKFSSGDTLFFAISQSGETADTLIAVKEAKKKGATIVSLVNARGSTLERLSDHVLNVGAGPEIAVVSTKAFTAQLATLYLLSRAVVGQYGDGIKGIEAMGSLIGNFLNPVIINAILGLAKSLMNDEHIYVIGKYLNFPAALEFALKIKETSYLHAEPFAAGELKHGVITLIQKGTPCFVLASQDEAWEEVLSSAAQLKARGGRIIGVAPSESAEFDVHIKTPDAGVLTVFVNIIVGQLLGYYLGVGRGADPDKPRNLAKSVTVK